MPRIFFTKSIPFLLILLLVLLLIIVSELITMPTEAPIMLPIINPRGKIVSHHIVTPFFAPSCSLNQIFNSSSGFHHFLNRFIVHQDIFFSKLNFTINGRTLLPFTMSCSNPSETSMPSILPCFKSNNTSFAVPGLPHFLCIWEVPGYPLYP